ncbi:hypothetical protein WMF20_23270 [Sorangium sp. So ce834]|uniref:hypothetical protein n=1 Tax=Sorangium sp. So ce834 TaxID=3133321 RepID=UPI003F5F3AB6
MNVLDSPFPLGWYTAGSHESFWGHGNTYMLIPYDQLPELEQHHWDGSFRWLPAPPERDTVLGVHEESCEKQLDLSQLYGEAQQAGIRIPDAFATFLTTPEIHRRVPTCTACYLELSTRLLEPPSNQPGRLLRFMNDQQACVLWYLYLPPDDVPAVVAGMPEWLDDASEGSLDDDDGVVFEQLVLCAPDFETFIYRFWIENAIWYALVERRPLTSAQSAYLDAVQRARRQSRA